jgi:hypothetical protein
MAVPLIIEAIGNISEQMTGETDSKAIGLELIGLFKREDNRHSYLNTVIAERQGVIVGVMVLYSSNKATELDANLVIVRETGGYPHYFNRQDEYYVMLCVHQNFVDKV